MPAIPDVTVLRNIVPAHVSLYLGGDESTRAATAALIADGTIWMLVSKRYGHDVLHISVSIWSTDAADVAFSIAAVKRAVDLAD